MFGISGSGVKSAVVGWRSCGGDAKHQISVIEQGQCHRSLPKVAVRFLQPSATLTFRPSLASPMQTHVHAYFLKT